MSFISRGFRGRRGADAPAGRVPPGQYLTDGFPVLSAGPTPRVDLAAWRLEVVGAVDRPRAWTWQEFMALPAEDVHVDIHCVTKWSKLDTSWRGVSVDALFGEVGTAGGFVLAHSYGGYTTNLPLGDLTGGKAWVAFEYDGPAARPRARRARATPGATPVLLEEREVDHAAWRCWPRTSPASGSAMATTTTVTHGASSATRATDLDMLEVLPPRRLSWQVATVVDRIEETARTRSVVLDVPEWPGHLPGQHVDVRLTADDGYQAQRSYSIATPADGGRVTITVERIADGEVSPYLVDELRVGDGLELRGPIGGYFVWQPGDGRPLVLAAGGSGLVPLMAMLRARVAAGTQVPVRLLALGEVRRRDHLSARPRDHRARAGRRRHRPHADPLAAARLDGPSAPGGPRHVECSRESARGVCARHSAATRRTCPSVTDRGKLGSPSVRRRAARPGARRACRLLCHTCTSGRVRSGSQPELLPRTSSASGSAMLPRSR